MKKVAKLLFNGVGAILLGVFALSIALEWAIWALWFVPAIGGLYIYMARRFHSLWAKYVGSMLLLMTLPWAVYLGAVILPRLSYWLAYMLNMPFNADEYGTVDGTPIIVLFMIFGAGVGMFAHVCAIHGSYRSATREARIVRYRIIGGSLGVAAAAALYTLGHPIVAGFSLFCVLMTVAAQSSETEDPQATMNKYANLSPETS